LDHYFVSTPRPSNPEERSEITVRQIEKEIERGMLRKVDRAGRG
jgi:hypothetical protein